MQDQTWTSRARPGVGGVAFEREVAARLSALGWRTENTPITGDFGADILASFDKELLAIQCKDYGSPVGLPAVQEAHFAKSHYRATAALVVARSGFTRAALAGAIATNVALIAPSELAFGSKFDRTTSRRYEQTTSQKCRPTISRDDIELAERAMGVWVEKSGLWLDFDEKTSSFHIKVQNLRFWRTLTIASGVLLVAATLASANWAAGDIPLMGLIFEIGMTYLVLKALLISPLPPKLPAFERQGCLIKCSGCGQRLRVEYARVGRVRCPSCKTLFRAST